MVKGRKEDEIIRLKKDRLNEQTRGKIQTYDNQKDWQTDRQYIGKGILNNGRIRLVWMHDTMFF